MKIGLVTTTINVPHVLRLYRALESWEISREPPKFFIALDQNSNLSGIAKADMSDPLMSWLTPDWQKRWKCSEPIGFKSVQRRNLATLEAIEWGADIICSVDDDNLPMGAYFRDVEHALLNKFNGLEAKSLGWFDPGEWMFPRDGIDPVVQRGIPQHLMRGAEITHVVGAKVGLVQGLILGDPDTSAVDRMSRHPQVHQISEVYRSGIVVDPTRTRTVVNSQNTAFVRELAPAFFMLPGIGRYDDIFGSLIMQRVMQETGHVIHFGKPFCWQSRNFHNAIKDLKDEVFGMDYLPNFVEWLDSIDLGQASVVSMVKLIFGRMRDLPWMPTQTREAGIAWCEDIEQMSAVS